MTPIFRRVHCVCCGGGGGGGGKGNGVGFGSGGGGGVGGDGRGCVSGVVFLGDVLLLSAFVFFARSCHHVCIHQLPRGCPTFSTRRLVGAAEADDGDVS